MYDLMFLGFARDPSLMAIHTSYIFALPAATESSCRIARSEMISSLPPPTTWVKVSLAMPFFSIDTSKKNSPAFAGPG